jgi:hypothetical protein
MLPMVIYHLKITVLAFAFPAFANHKHDLMENNLFQWLDSPDACNLIINLEYSLCDRVCAEKGQLEGQEAGVIVYLS